MDSQESEDIPNPRRAVVPGEPPSDNDELYDDFRRHTRKRPVKTPEPRHCPECRKWVEVWEPRTLPTFMYAKQGRCPDCFHINDADKLEKTRKANLESRCACGCGRRVYLSEKVCTCPCKCEDTDRQDDADFEVDSQDENEDDIVTELDARTENFVARKYGWQTNVVSNQDTDDERRIFYEAPGHATAAHVHDIGIPSESAICNSENITGPAEVRDLGQGIEPWELEALHKSTGRSYQDLKKIFKEARHMETPSSPVVDERTRQREPVLMCPNCYKSPTDEFLRWLRSGNMSICALCGMTVRPQRPEEDPDWHNYHPSLTDVLAHCHCRCLCAATQVRPANGTLNNHNENETTNSIRSTEYVHIGLSESEPDYTATYCGNLAAEEPSFAEGLPVSDAPQVNYRIGSSGIDLMDALRRLGEASGRTVTGRNSLDYNVMLTGLRVAFDLPELHLATDPDPRRAGMEDVERAIENARVAQAFEEYEEALQYIDFADQAAFYWAGLTHDHFLVNEVRALEQILHERLDAQNDAEDDEMDDEVEPEYSGIEDENEEEAETDIESVEEGEFFEDMDY